jgi:hypothetical protein
MSGRSARFITAAAVVATAFAMGDRLGNGGKDLPEAGISASAAPHRASDGPVIHAEQATPGWLGAAESWAAQDSARAEAELADNTSVSAPPEAPAVDRDSSDRRELGRLLASANKAVKTPGSDAPKSQPSSASSDQTGDVVITCGAGSATVWKGETYLGPTPLRTRLPAGKHHLTVKPKDGGRDFPVVADVNPGRLALVNVGP